MIGRFAGVSTALLLAVALALGACGRKGDLRAPEGEEDAYTGPGVYPAPESVVPQEGEAAARADEEDPESSAEGAGGP